MDLAGYYATDRGDRFFPVSPVRAIDTRLSGGPVGAGGTRIVPLATRISPFASTAVLNDTANAAVVALGTDARITLYNNAGSTDLVVDVASFFASSPYCADDCLYAWGGS